MRNVRVQGWAQNMPRCAFGLGMLLALLPLGFASQATADFDTVLRLDYTGAFRFSSPLKQDPDRPPPAQGINSAKTRMAFGAFKVYALSPADEASSGPLQTAGPAAQSIAPKSGPKPAAARVARPSTVAPAPRPTELKSFGPASAVAAWVKTKSKMKPPIGSTTPVVSPSTAGRDAPRAADTPPGAVHTANQTIPSNQKTPSLPRHGASSRANQVVVVADQATGSPHRTGSPPRDDAASRSGLDTRTPKLRAAAKLIKTIATTAAPVKPPATATNPAPTNNSTNSTIVINLAISPELIASDGHFTPLISLPSANPRRAARRAKQLAAAQRRKRWRSGRLRRAIGALGAATGTRPANSPSQATSAGYFGAEVRPNWARNALRIN